MMRTFQLLPAVVEQKRNSPPAAPRRAQVIRAPVTGDAHADVPRWREARGVTNTGYGDLVAAARPALQLQAKLKVGTADSPLEREADQVADSVLAGDAPASTQGAGSSPQVQRQAKDREKGEELVHRKPIAALGAA